MGKKILLKVFIFVALSGYAQGGQNRSLERSVFDDAVTLLRYHQEMNKPTATRNEKADALIEQLSILAFYFKDNNEIVQFNSDYAGIGMNMPTEAGALKMATEYSVTIPETKNIVKGTSTVAIDAIGTFLADRFKKEINVAFLNKFREQLKTMPYLGEFFPLSKKLLFESDPYNYPVFIGTLRQAFEQDLTNLTLIYPDILKRFNSSDPERNLIINSLGSILSGRDLPTLRAVMNEIASAEKIEKWKVTMKIAAVSLNAVSKSENSGFISRQDLALFNNDTFLKYYIGLLIRQNDGYFNWKDIIITKWGGANDKLKTTRENLQKIILCFEQVNSIVATTENTSSEKITAVVTATLSSLRNCLQDAYKYEYFGKVEDIRKVDNFLEHGEALTKTILYIQTKQYGLATTNICSFIVEIAGDRLTPVQKTLINKYGGFIADMLNAKDKEDMLKALDNSANPVGSYRIKRNSTFNISLNGYAGGFYGNDLKSKSLYGITAPVGIYFGWGNQLKSVPYLANDNGKSIGLFMTLIDVGAVASFRLEDKETEFADVSWDNVFAPGLYLSLGFGKSPITLNLGGQMGPALKSINNDGSPVVEEKKWYWRAGLVVDIPLFDFYVKQKEYKIATESTIIKKGPLSIIEPRDLGKFVNINGLSDPSLDKLDTDKIERIFSFFKHSFINWNDKNNCEDRADAVCNILKNEKISCGKIWIFKKIAMDSDKAIFINNWSYHVAAYVLDENGKERIIDPALFSDKSGSTEEWTSQVVVSGKGHLMKTLPDYYVHLEGKSFSDMSSGWKKGQDIRDKNSEVIEGLAGTRWYKIFKKGKKKQEAFNKYEMLKTTTKDFTLS